MSYFLLIRNLNAWTYERGKAISFNLNLIIIEGKDLNLIIIENQRKRLWIAFLTLVKDVVSTIVIFYLQTTKENEPSPHILIRNKP